MALVAVLIILATVDVDRLAEDLKNSLGDDSPGGSHDGPDNPSEDPPNIPDVEYVLDYLPGVDADSAVAYLIPQITIVQDAEGYLPASGTALDVWTPDSPGEVPDLSAAETWTGTTDAAVTITIMAPSTTAYYRVNISAAAVQAAPGGLSISWAIGIAEPGQYHVLIYWWEYPSPGETVSRWDTWEAHPLIQGMIA